MERSFLRVQNPLQETLLVYALLEENVSGNNTIHLDTILEIRPDIFFACVVSKGKPFEMQYKQGGIMPTEEDMERMLMQVEILSSIIQTNEKVAGDKEFLLISHSNIKVMIVPLVSGSDRKTLVTTFTQFRDIESLVEAVLEKATTLASES